MEKKFLIRVKVNTITMDQNGTVFAMSEETAGYFKDSVIENNSSN